MRCGACGSENRESSKFCSECGAALAAASGPAREERKIVTVLFCDIVGSTARAERLDPEDVRAILSPYYARVRSELERFGGTVEKFIGDAVVAVFGAPVAHEDDPERAVRAALAVRDALAELNEDDPRLELHVRMAVNTGEALVTIGARPSEGEGMVAGDVVNTAARLQSAAPVDGIFVGEATYRATERVVEYRPGAPVHAKGKSAPIAAYEAIAARARFGVDVAQRVRTELVGRAKQLDLLADALARARDDRSPQLVTLVGVPGIGKSRLVYELFQLVDADPELIFWRQGRSLPYGEGVTYWALGEMAKSQAGILESDTAHEAEEKLHRAVAALVDDEAEAQWVEGHLRPLVGLSRESEPSGDRRGEAFAAWRRFLEALADRGPLVLVFEDLHWADEGLLDFVDELVDWVSGVPLLVVCSARPELLERRPGWGGGKRNAVTISLAPLSDEDTARLVAALLERPVIPADAQSAVLARAGGNPLYAEEYARMLADRGVDGLVVPETVQGIIAARLDVLAPEEKDLVFDASVLGKVFWLGALAHVSGLERWTVEQRLRPLERKEFIRRERRSSVAAEQEYAFLHVLVRDVAYGQLPRAARAERHRRVAEWLEGLGGDRSEDRAEMLAHHYLQALEYARATGASVDDLAGRARVALHEAGQRALQLNAFAAAVRFLGAAVELGAAPEPQLLLDYGRALLVGAGAGDDVLAGAEAGFRAASDDERAAEAAMMQGELVWMRGRHEDAFAHFRRAAELIDGRPPSPSTGFVLGQLSRFYMLAEEHGLAISLGRQALEIATRLRLDEQRAVALNNIGVARVTKGDPGGLADLEESIAIGDRVSSGEAIRGRLNLASLHANLGDFRRARELHEQALTLAQRLGAAAPVRWLTAEKTLDLYAAGEWDEAARIADEFLAEVDAGTPHYMAHGVRATRAFIRLARGDSDGAMVDGARSLEAARSAHDPQSLYPSLAGAARLRLEVGQPEEAEALADELIERTRERPFLASEWFLWLALVLTELGRGAEVGPLAERVGPPTRFVDCALAYAAGDARESADALAAMGSLADEAYVRLRAAERLCADGRRAAADAELRRSLAFYRSAGATAYVRRGESLLAAAS